MWTNPVFICVAQHHFVSLKRKTYDGLFKHRDGIITVGMYKEQIQTEFDLEYFFELSPDLICIAGYDGYFRRINPAVSKTLKFTTRELMSRPISSLIHPDDQNLTASTRVDLTNGTPLLNFENRYITRDGEIVWLQWTSIPIAEQQLIFAIAKNITIRKMEEKQKVMETDNKKAVPHRMTVSEELLLKNDPNAIHTSADKLWLEKLESLVRKYTGKVDLNLKMLSDEMAIGERQLFRRIKVLLGTTPNHYIRIIRLQIALDAIQTGKYSTISEIAYIAGFQTPAYFKKLFKEEYRFDIGDLL